MARSSASKNAVISGASISGDFNVINLDGKPYRIDLSSYRGKDVTDFAPRASTPGGDTKFSELNLYQPVTFTDWRHGFGFHWHTDASGYQMTSGFVDTRQANIAMLNSLPLIMSSTQTGYIYGNSHDPDIMMFHGRNAGTASTKATSGTSLTLTKAAAGWGTDAYARQIVAIYSGAGVGQHRRITSNTDTTLTFSPAMSPAPDGTSYFVIYYEDLAYFRRSTGAITTVLPFECETVNFFWNNGTFDFVGISDGFIYRTEDITVNYPVAAPFYYNVIAAFSDTTIKTDTPAPGWTVNQWENYMVIITAGVNAGQTANIVSNTADVLTLEAALPLACDATTQFIITNWIRCGVNANSKDYDWLVAHNGFCFAGKHGVNEVYYDATADAKSSSIDLSGLHGNKTDDPSCILVGTPGKGTKGAISFNGDLYFFRDDSVYKMAADRTSASKVLDFVDQTSPTNFSGYAVFNGQLVFNIRNHLFSWNGVRMTDVTPPRISDTFPYKAYGAYSNMVVIGSYLWMYAADTDSVDSMAAIVCWDGVGWHKMVDGLPNQIAMGFMPEAHLPHINRLYYDPIAPALWFSMIGNAAITYLYAMVFDPRTDFPYNNFPRTLGDWYPFGGALFTPKIDAGYRRILKSTPSVLIEASNLSSGTAGNNQYLLVYFSRDGEAFLPWGGTDGVTNLVDKTGVTELRNPSTGLTDAGTFNTLEFYYLQIKVAFWTDDADKSPILNGIHVRVIMRPVTTFGYAFNVIAEPYATEYGVSYTDDRGPYEIVRDLRIVRDSAKPVTFVDVFGITHYVYVTAINELAIQQDVDQLANGMPAVETAIQVNLITVDGVRYV